MFVIKITEQQLIKEVSSYYNVHEINTKSYLKLGYFKTSLNTYKSFIKKVNSIYTSYERLDKTGQQVEYIIGEKRPEPLPIEDKRIDNGGNNNKLDNKIAQEMLKLLYETTYDKEIKINTTKSLQVKDWVQKLNLPYINDSKYSGIKYLLGNFLEGKTLTLTSSAYKRRIYDRSIRTFKSSVNILAKENKILCQIEYYKQMRDYKEINIDLDEYKTLIEQLKDYLDLKGYKLKDIYYNSFDREIIKVMRKYIESTGIKNLFVKYRIKVLETDIKSKYDSTLFNEMYFERLDQLSNKIAQSSQNKKFPYYTHHNEIMTVLNSYLRDNLTSNDIKTYHSSEYEKLKGLRKINEELDEHSKNDFVKEELETITKEDMILEIDDIMSGFAEQFNSILN